MGSYSLVESRHQLGQLIFYDSEYQQRWVDAIGPKVVKFIEDFGADVASPTVGTWVVGGASSEISSFTMKGGGVRLMADASAGDTVQMQKLNGFVACTACPIYFGVRWKLYALTESTTPASVQTIMGLHDEDTSVCASPNTGIVFEIATAATGLDMVCYSTGTGVTMTALTTVAADTWYTDEFYWDGSNAVNLYHDGTYIGAASAGSIAKTSAMCVTLGLYNVAGNTVNNGLIIDWVRAIQLMDTRYAS